MKLKSVLLTTALAVAYTSSASAQVTVANTVVSGSINTNGGTTLSFTYAPVNPGNTLVFGTYSDNNHTATGVTFDGVPAGGFIHNGRSTVAYTTTSDVSVDVVLTFTGTGGTNGGYVLYELSGVSAGDVDLGTGASIPTTDDGKFVVNFAGINFGTGAGTVPASGSIITTSAVADYNGGIGGGALAYGYGIAGLAGSQTLGWTFSNGSGTGDVSAAFPTGVNPDSDGDGLLDVWEMNHFGDLTSARGSEAQDPSLGDDWDQDEDGFDNEAEETAGSNPNNPDSIPGDIDGDDFADADEIAFFGNLNQSPAGDFDGDYSSNIDEITAATSPTNANDWPDIDDDGMSDGWETANGLNVGADDSGDHADTDGFTNLQEFQAGTDPQDAAWSPEHAILAHRWSFTGDLVDSVGGNDAQIANDDALNIGFSSLQNPTNLQLFGGAKASSDYVLLGNNLLSDLQSDGVKPVTIELWATQDAVGNWSRMWDFGNDVNGDPGANGSLRMTWLTGTNVNTDQVEWAGNGNSTSSNAPYVPGAPYHIVMTIVPAAFANGAIAQGCTVTWYSAPADDSQAAGHPLNVAKGTFNTTSDLRSLIDSVCYLGRSMWPDATASATYDEVRIWKGALTETERELFQLLGPDNVDRSDADNGGLGDGFPDQWEIARFGDTETAMAGVDADGDGDNDDVEFTEESNPNDILSTIADRDNDDLDDVWEMQYFNNLLQLGTDDPDGDFVENEVEETNGTDPSDMNSSPDLDGDGISDGWEYFWFGDLTTAETTLNSPSDTNFDGDLDTDVEEFQGGWDPTNHYSGRDTDNDQLPDYWEFVFFEPTLGASYLAFNGTNDFDNDKASHANEFADGTDPTDGGDFKDVNADGFYDGVQLTATDGFLATSFNTALNWSDGLAPAAGKNYLVFGQILRSPDVDNTNLVTVFAGDKLVISGGGSLWLKGATSTASANYVLHDGAIIRNAASAPGPITVDGTLAVSGTASELFANNGAIVVGAVVSGSSDLNLTGANAVQFTAANSYSGDITLSPTTSLVVDGTLAPGADSVYHLAPQAGGATNSIGGFGTLTLAGTLDIDLTAATPTAAATTWNLITAFPTYDPAFTVTGSGFTPDGGAVGARIWTDGTGDYVFDESTGVLSFVGVLPGYVQWAGTAGLTAGVNDGAEDNPDVDPYDNVLEYQLGGNPLAFDGDLVTATESETHLVFTFERFDASENDSTLNFRWGADLATWNTVPVIPGTDGNGVVVTVTEDGGSTADYDLIEIQLPKSNALGGKLFGQLEGTQP